MTAVPAATPPLGRRVKPAPTSHPTPRAVVRSIAWPLGRTAGLSKFGRRCRRPEPRRRRCTSLGRSIQPLKFAIFLAGGSSQRNRGCRQRAGWAPPRRRSGAAPASAQPGLTTCFGHRSGPALVIGFKRPEKARAVLRRLVRPGPGGSSRPRPRPRPAPSHRSGAAARRTRFQFR